VNRKDGALLLNLSERFVFIVASSIQSEGLSAILPENKGKVPTNKLTSEMKATAHGYAVGKNYSFNILHMHEKLRFEIKCSVSHSWTSVREDQSLPS
jgi:hypothetical protein